MSLKSISLYTAIIIATLIGAEALARLYSWTPQGVEGITGDSYGPARYAHSTSGAGDLMPDQDGHWLIWHHRPYHVQTNSVGLRATEEPREGALRILALGDSQTFGPYVANEDAWPAWLENRLRLDGRDVQVFNAGISGYTILDQYNYMRDKGVAFRPTLVLLAVYENDVLDLKRENNGRVQRPHTLDVASEAQRALRCWLRQTALHRLIEDWRHRQALASAGVDTRAGEGVTSAPAAPDEGEQRLDARYSDIFADMVKLLQDHHIGFQVIFIPAAEALEDQPSRVEPLIRRLCQKFSIPYNDMTPVLKENHGSVDRFYLMQRNHKTRRWEGNAHLSREGHAIIGKNVYIDLDR